MSEFFKGRGAYPDSTDWLEGCGRNLEVQTDKDAWKVVPCTHAECDCDLVVNTFYAPVKAKCSRHGEHTATAIATSHLVAVSDPATAKPNGALAKCECPICGSPMLVHRVDEATGAITLRCGDKMELTVKDINRIRNNGLTGGMACGTAVIIKPGLAWAEPKNYPSRLRDLIEDWNIGQRVDYYDKIEAKNEPKQTVPAST